MLEKISNVYRNRRRGSKNARSPSPTFNHNLRSLLFPLSWSFPNRSQMALDLIYRHFVLRHGNTRTHWNFTTERECSRAWWYLPAISALGRWRQKGQEFKVILCYLVTLRPAWVIWDLLKGKASNQNVLVTAIHSPHIKTLPLRFSVVSETSWTLSSRFQFRIQINTFTHCDWLNEHRSGTYPRGLSGSCFFVCWFSWNLFLKKAGHLACSKLCYRSFIFRCEVCRLLVFMVLKLNCSLFGSHKVQSCLAYPLYHRKAGRMLSSLPGTEMVLAFACCILGRRSWGELLAECPQH